MSFVCVCEKTIDVWWTTGAAAAANKSMIVQILTPGGAGGDVKRNDLILLTPGGGVGPLSTGCTAQYGNGFSWYVTSPHPPFYYCFILKILRCNPLF